jgi:hypothetical protein
MAGKRETRKTRMGYGIPHLNGDDDPTVADGTPNIPPSPPEVLPPFAAPAVPPVFAPYGQPPPGAVGMGALAAPGANGMRVQPQMPPAVEIEYIHENDASAGWNTPWTMLQVWTRNRIYCIDDSLQCHEVINRETGIAEAGHSLLGTRLTGGQRRSKNSTAVEIVVPFPVPGMEAVFKRDNRRHGQYGQTSTVERVVIRMRRIRVGGGVAEPMWDGLTGRFQVR